MPTVWLALLFSTAAGADGAALHQEGEGPPRTFGNLRVGGSTSSRHPEVCLEVNPLERFGLEACGTGSGFLHHDDEAQISHFRGTARLASLPLGDGWLLGTATVGFAELQQGEDESGFVFNGADANGNSTAGAEVGVGARYVMPMAGGFDFIGAAHAAMAYLPHAGELRSPMSAWQPTASLTLGVGF